MSHIPCGGPFLPQPACIPSEHQHSLFLDLICSSPSNLLRMALSLASMPQVNEGLVYVQNNHGSPGPQAATVTGHLQQVPLHGYLSSHTIQSPFTCRDGSGRVMKEQAWEEWLSGCLYALKTSIVWVSGTVAEGMLNKDSSGLCGGTNRLPKVHMAEKKSFQDLHKITKALKRETLRM